MKTGKIQSRLFLIFATIAFIICTTSCGFLREARVTKSYHENIGPDSVEECLITWPFHAILYPVTAIIDQVIHTFEIIPEAWTDAADYLYLRGNGNNIMLERTIAVPKTLATPVVYILSYISRWFFPIDEHARPFEPKPAIKELEKEKPKDKQKTVQAGFNVSWANE